MRSEIGQEKRRESSKKMENNSLFFFTEEGKGKRYTATMCLQMRKRHTETQEIKRKTKGWIGQEKERIWEKHFRRIKWKYLLSLSPSSTSSYCSQGLGWSCIPTRRSQSLLLPATQFLDLVQHHAGQRRRRRRSREARRWGEGGSLRGEKWQTGLMFKWLRKGSREIRGR